MGPGAAGGSETPDPFSTTGGLSGGASADLVTAAVMAERAACAAIAARWIRKEPIGPQDHAVRGEDTAARAISEAIWKRPPPGEGGTSLYRDVPATRRVRLVLVGRVRHVRPDGKGRGYEIGLDGPVQLPLVDDAGPWVRALPPLAGAEDRGRWRVVKWRAGCGGAGDVIVVGTPSAVVHGDSLWLEVPADE